MPAGGALLPGAGGACALGSLKTFSVGAGSGAGVAALVFLPFFDVPPEVEGGAVCPAGAVMTTFAGIFQVGIFSAGMAGTCSVMSVLFGEVTVTSDLAAAVFGASARGACFGASAAGAAFGVTRRGSGGGVACAVFSGSAAGAGSTTIGAGSFLADTASAGPKVTRRCSRSTATW